MLRVQLPFLFLPTREARDALGARVKLAGVCAFVEIARATRALEVAHLQFEFDGLTLAVCSRVRANGLVEIEAGPGNPNLPRRTFTAEEARRAAQAAMARARPAARAVRHSPR